MHEWSPVGQGSVFAGGHGAGIDSQAAADRASVNKLGDLDVNAKRLERGDLLAVRDGTYTCTIITLHCKNNNIINESIQVSEP